MLDEKFMQEALEEARRAFTANEVPVGAVLVHKEKIIARSYNQVEILQEATAHAEMQAIRIGAAHFQNFRLLETTLYCTLEPCIMCFGALLLSRVKRLVYGAKDLRQGALGSWINLLEKPHPLHKIEVTGGILAQESASLLQQFFSQRRNNTK